MEEYMAKGTGRAIAGIITLIIGGTVYSVSQADIVSKFSEETGMSQKEAEQYVENIPEDELFSFDELGSMMISEGQDILGIVTEIDCVNYYYEWETDTLSCEEGKSQFRRFGESEIALGEAYRVLNSDSASTEDIYTAIRLIDEVNENYSLEIMIKLLDYSDRDESIKTNLYNKALLQAALDSQ
jgi:hypothetical protein